MNSDILLSKLQNLLNTNKVNLENKQLVCNITVQFIITQPTCVHLGVCQKSHYPPGIHHAGHF